MAVPLRVLILEDRAADAELMLHELRQAGYAPEWVRVESEAEYLAALDPALDVILADSQLPQSDAMRALQLAQGCDLDVPFIIVSGTIGEAQAVEYVNQGAADYLLKDRLGRLGQAVARALERARQRKALGEVEAGRRRLFEDVPVGLVRTTWDGQVLDANPALAEILGHPDPRSMMGRNMRDGYVDPADRGRMMDGLARAEIVRDFEAQLRRADGTPLWAHLSLRSVTDGTGRLLHLEGAVVHVTARKQGEAERARLYEEIGRRAGEATALAEVARLLSGTLDMDQVLDLIVHEVRRTLGVPFAGIMQVDEARRELSYTKAAGVSPELLAAVRLKAGEGVAGRALATGAPAQNPDLLRDRDYPYRGFAEEEGFRSILCAPFAVRGEVRGVLVVFRAEEHEFSEAEVQLLTRFADQAAVALENARLHALERRRGDALAALVRAARAVTSSLHLPHIFETVVSSAQELTGASMAHLFVMHGEDRLVPGASAGPLSRAYEEEFGSAPQPVGAGFTGQVASRGESLWVPDVAAHPGALRPAFHARHGIASYLGVPLRAGDRVLGVLRVMGRPADGLAEEHRETLESLGAQATIAIENSRLFQGEQARRRQLEAVRAVTEDITGELDLQSVLHLITQRAAELLRSSSGAVWLWDDRAEVLGPGAWAGHGKWMRELRLRPGEGLVGIVARDRRGLIVNDYQGWPHAFPAFKSMGVTAVMGEPLVFGEELLGVIAISDERGERQFSQADRELLALLAGHGAIAIQNARLYGQARDARDFLQSIAANSPDTIITVNLEDRITYVSPGVQGMLGYRSEELLGHLCREYLRGGEAEVQAIAGRLEAEGRIGHHQTGMRAKDGRWVDVSISISQLRSASGERVGRVGVVRDITERRRAEEQARQAEKLATMGQLLAGVAHELNNPLSIIMGQAMLLQEKLGCEPVEHRTRKIQEAAERCARIVQNFLALARQRPPKREPVMLNQIVREVVELLAYPLRVDTVQVTLDLAGDLPPFLGDHHQLQQVLVNLITNAHHALRQAPKPRALTIATCFDAPRGRICLQVADTGPGIPPEIRGRIFEPFFTTKPEGQGTGLGLSLCQGIIEGHGGSIRVEGEPPRGAVFVMELPAQPPPRAPAQAPAAEALPPIRGRSILIVDDERFSAELLAELLAADGHRVEAASSGLEALEMIGKATYDLILSDVKMPELDGPGLYHEVTGRQPALRQRFIFLTGDSLTAETAEFLARTGAPTLEKPFTLDEVRHLIQRVLQAQQAPPAAGPQAMPSPS